MSDYTKLKEIWPTLTGTDEEKFSQIKAMRADPAPVQAPPPDDGKVPWWSVNGFLSEPGLGDLVAAGLVPKPTPPEEA